jgi:glycosyltransferase involved in cell wall biosynthesis
MILVLLCLLCSLNAEQTVAIFTGWSVKRSWDPDSIKNGLTGSEEAVVYMSQELAKLGYRVVVFADVPSNSRHSSLEANPRFVEFAYNDGTMYDIGISWRMPHVAADVRTRARKVYFWPHDNKTTFLLSEEEIRGFDDVFWLSKSHRQQWVDAHPAFARFTKIFGNGIVPEQFEDVQERSNPYSCIYASSYDRGLEALLDIWPWVKKEFPQATLDIYYGWESLALKLEPPIDELRMKAKVAYLSLLDVVEHGSVGHEELNRAFGRASFWTYPCTQLLSETFCITALRAQFAGAIPVIISGSALEETVRFGYKCREPKEYLATLLCAMKQVSSLEERKKQREFILQEYTWKTLAAKWSALFKETEPLGGDRLPRVSF